MSISSEDKGSWRQLHMVTCCQQVPSVLHRYLPLVCITCTQTADSCATDAAECRRAAAPTTPSAAHLLRRAGWEDLWSQAVYRGAQDLHSGASYRRPK